ncbi:uncharacterized protein LOC129586832 [Paramacrobiotus metropolitanus]|uniref:uncharacterized protein LOC129586832 n=1 Tax=Paramacrobiotus metropolitanus TaxID=2943436 RepID=UPI0024463FC2|nr:uncharacterized protein LOC129586832 [Paramacrobiotus metropolitanus]
MDENPKHTHNAAVHHKTDDAIKRSSVADDLKPTSSDGDDFHGMPLGARISYHAGLNLDEREAFKLCFPSYAQSMKPADPSTAGSGDNISMMIKKMRSTMGSMDPNAEAASSQSEDEGNERTVPVHYTESSTDLVSGMDVPDTTDSTGKHDLVNRFIMEETPHSVGDYGAGRRSSALPGKNPTGNDCHVFSEGPATAGRTDQRQRHHNLPSHHQ